MIAAYVDKESELGWAVPVVGLPEPRQEDSHLRTRHELVGSKGVGSLARRDTQPVDAVYGRTCPMVTSNVSKGLRLGRAIPVVSLP